MPTPITTAGSADASPDLAGVARRRGVCVLWGACLLGGLGQSLAAAAGALLAVEVSGSEGPAGLPQATLVVGAAGSALALSRLTVTRGRTCALTTGVVVAVVGCGVVAIVATAESLSLVLLGSLLLGSGSTAVMLARYAAAELGPTSARGRAMGLVLAATAVGGGRRAQSARPSERTRGSPRLANARGAVSASYRGLRGCAGWPQEDVTARQFPPE